MDSLLPSEKRRRRVFREFGPTAFSHGRWALRGLDVAADRRQLRRGIRDLCPAGPGVYGMIDRAGQLCYVGMSRHLRGRLLSYFASGPDGSKQQRIAGQAVRVVWEAGPHEFTARLRELELIRRFRPRLNVVGRPRRRQVGYLFLTAGDAPRFRVDALPPRNVRWTWGPLTLSPRTRRAVEQLNLVFQLRDCGRDVPMRFAEQRDLFPMQHAAACLRGDVGTCLAPCAGRCTHGDYARQLAAARALLDGLDRLPLERLEAQMAQASAALQFERAGALRDAWDRLTYLAGEIELVRDVRQDYWFVYPTPGHGGRTHWNLIAGGDVAAVVRSPESPASAHRCLEALEAAYAGQRHRSLAPPDDYGQLRLVASWFRQHPGEIDRVLEPAAALARCRDYR